MTEPKLVVTLFSREELAFKESVGQALTGNIRGYCLLVMRENGEVESWKRWPDRYSLLGALEVAKATTTNRILEAVDTDAQGF